MTMTSEIRSQLEKVAIDTIKHGGTTQAWLDAGTLLALLEVADAVRGTK